MKRNNSKSRPTFARRKFLMEGLEPRCMLAGNVNVFVSGGTLFVQGDSQDNLVLIQDEGGGTYSVSGLDFDADLDLSGQGFASGPTTINHQNTGGFQGEPLLFHGVTNDINVDLKGGNDGLGMGNDLNTLNNLALDCFGIGFQPTDNGGSGDGGNEINPNQAEATFQVPRNLIVNLGDGNDFTAINANVGASNPNGSVKKGGVANINLGNGVNGAAFGDANVADDLLINGGNGDDNACVTDVSVHDLLAVQLGDGAENQTDIEDFEAGHALVTSGKGNDQVLISGFDLARELTVVTGAGDDQVEVENFNAQSVTIDTGSGNDGTGGEREIPSITPALLTLDSPITVSNASISKALVLVTGSGNDFATVNNVSAHDIVVDTGAGNDGDEGTPISIYNINVQGNVTLVTGAGNDNAYMHSGDGNTSNIGGYLTIDMGSDNDNLEVVDQTVGKDMTVVLGNGNNNAGIGAGVGEAVGMSEVGLTVKHNLTIVGGPNTDNVGLFNLSVRNDLFADLGAGNDFLQIGNEEESTVQVGRDATLIGNAGNDEMTIDFLTVGRNALLDAGAGNDDVSIDNSHVAKTATLLMGAGNDTLTLTNSTAGKLLARGGAGSDTFNNDLGIVKNGKTSTTDVAEFEFFGV